MPSTRARKTAAAKTPSPPADVSLPEASAPAKTPRRRAAALPVAVAEPVTVPAAAPVAPAAAKKAARKTAAAPAKKPAAKKAAKTATKTAGKRAAPRAPGAVAVVDAVLAGAPASVGAASAAMAVGEVQGGEPGTNARRRPRIAAEAAPTEGRAAEGADRPPSQDALVVTAPAVAKRPQRPRRKAAPLLAGPGAEALPDIADPVVAPASAVPTETASESAPAEVPEAHEVHAPLETPAQAPLPPAISRITLQPDAHGHRLVWEPAADCPAPIADLAASLRTEDGGLDPLQDAAWLTLQAQAHADGHALQIDPAAWAAVARGRDVRWRVHHLEQAYPEGAASAALRALWADGAARLAPYHLEGALFAACAGRALLADEAGLDPAPQALLAAQLFARHFGVQRVLLLCPDSATAHWQRLRLQAGLDERVQLRLGPQVPADGWQPELVIVDDLHRWPDAPPSAALQTLHAPYALVLMHEPADRPEGLAAWLAGLDIDGLGPARHFLQRHRTDAGWQGLDRLRDTLGAVMLRRTRSRWLQPVPGRRDTLQWVAADEASRFAWIDGLRRLEPIIDRWRRVGYVSDLDQLVVHDVLTRWREGSPADELQKRAAVRTLWSHNGAHGRALRLLAASPQAAERWAEALQVDGLPARAEAGAAEVWVEPAATDAESAGGTPRVTVVALSLPWPADVSLHGSAHPRQDGRPITYLLTDGGLDHHRLLLRCCDAVADAALADGARFCQGAALARRMAALGALLDRAQDALFRHAW